MLERGCRTWRAAHRASCGSFRPSSPNPCATVTASTAAIHLYAILSTSTCNLHRIQTNKETIRIRTVFLFSSLSRGREMLDVVSTARCRGGTSRRVGAAPSARALQAHCRRAAASAPVSSRAARANPASKFPAQSRQCSRRDRRRHHRAVRSHRLLHHRLSEGGRCAHLQGRTDGDARGAVHLRPRRALALRHRPARRHQRDPHPNRGAHLPAHPGYEGPADAAEGCGPGLAHVCPQRAHLRLRRCPSATPRFRPVCARCSPKCS